MRIALLAAAIAAVVHVSSANANGRCEEFAPQHTEISLFNPDYTVEVIEGESALPQLEPESWAWHHRDIILAASKCPANFAGHYNLVHWSNGTESWIGVIVDRRNGLVTQLPNASWRYAFRPDSKLLVVDPILPSDADRYIPSHVVTTVWQWIWEADDWYQLYPVEQEGLDMAETTGSID